MKQTPKASGGQYSKSSVGASSRLNKSVKPNLQWIPKIPVSVCLNNEQDMSWEPIVEIDVNGEPSVKMDWVPKSN